MNRTVNLELGEEKAVGVIAIEIAYGTRRSIGGITLFVQKITEYSSVEGEKRILFLLSLSDEELEEQLKNASVYDRIYIWYLKEKEKNE